MQYRYHVWLSRLPAKVHKVQVWLVVKKIRFYDPWFIPFYYRYQELGFQKSQVKGVNFKATLHYLKKT